MPLAKLHFENGIGCSWFYAYRVSVEGFPKTKDTAFEMKKAAALNFTNRYCIGIFYRWQDFRETT